MLIIFKVPNHERKLGKDWVNTKTLSINMWKTHFAKLAAARVSRQPDDDGIPIKFVD